MGDFVHGPRASISLPKEVDAFDPEKSSADVEHGTNAHRESVVMSHYEVGHVKAIQDRVAILRYLNNGEQWLDRKMGVETRGIDRIPEEEKEPPSILNVFLLWFSLNCHVGVLPLGVLGPEFGLSLGSSIGAAVVGILLGSLTTAFCGTLGPKLGLRAIATSRYSFGFWGAKLCSVLNIIVGGGFAVVNYVIVGEILAACSDYTMSIVVGIIIIAVISYVISLFGFKLIHTWEKYSWIMTFILFCVLIGQAAPHVDSSIPNAYPVGSLLYAGNFLSIIAINFSNASGWCSIAADYYCNYPAKTPAWKIFGLTYLGIVIPTCFSIIIGTCLGNAAIGNYDVGGYAPYTEAYTDHGLGGLISEIYHPRAWSKFCLVFLTFSVLGNNIAINYSSGLSLQLLGSWFHAIPRFIWSLAVAVVITLLAAIGRQHLSTIVSNFVSLLGYWTVAFTLILLIEDKFFRRHEGYILEDWNTPSRLPWGVAAVFALLCGYLAGGVPGMAQTWYIGPIAAKFGGYGGDVGIYMSAVITILVYPISRTIEKKYTGR